MKLEENYRSSPRILKVAASVLTGNERRIDKTLHSGQAEPGGPVCIVECGEPGVAGF